MDCLFCKIINGEIPSTKVYEDDLVVAFMDISQITDGHTLVVPKQHFTNFLDINSNVLAHLNIVAQKIAQAMMKSLDGIKGINIINNCGEKAGQVVMHYHLHLIPRYDNDGFSINHLDNSNNINFDKLAKLAKSINSNI
ncbi:MAG: HIT family protein [Bacilli bacterium]|nr:HIT family protein [Bacilli bacterium]